MERPVAVMIAGRRALVLAAYDALLEGQVGPISVVGAQVAGRPRSAGDAPE